MDKLKGFVVWYNQENSIGGIEEQTSGIRYVFAGSQVMTVDKHLDENDYVSFNVDNYGLVTNITLIL